MSRKTVIGPNAGSCFNCKEVGHWSRECPRKMLPPGPCPLCKLTGHRKWDCALLNKRGQIPRLELGNPPVRISSIPRNLLGLLQSLDWQAPTLDLAPQHKIDLAKPQVLGQAIAGKKINFLIDTWATYSVLSRVSRSLDSLTYHHHWSKRQTSTYAPNLWLTMLTRRSDLFAFLPHPSQLSHTPPRQGPFDKTSDSSNSPATSFLPWNLKRLCLWCSALPSATRNT